MQSTLAFTNESFNGDNSVGYRLRCAREHLQLSLRDVAKALHLLVSHVRAIEADRCEELAGDDEFLVYLSKYASLVGLDGRELINSYHQQLVNTDEPIQPLSDENTAPGFKRKAWIALAVFLAVCVCLGVWLVNLQTPLQSALDGTNTATGEYPSADSLGSTSLAAANTADDAGPGRTAQPLRIPKPLHHHSSENARPQNGIRSAKDEPRTGLRDSQWFASLAADRYTLQLLSLSKQASAEAFIRNRKLQDQAAYIAIRNSDKRTWYTVTYGLYDSFAAAKKATQSLPESIRLLKPRVRSTGRLQQLMVRD